MCETVCELVVLLSSLFGIYASEVALPFRGVDGHF
jgi:hypothetical protein